MAGFEESPGLWLCTTAHVYEHALTRELAPLGLTAQSLQLLLWIDGDEGLSQTELAERMQMEPATFASLLKRMERDGWIHRRDSPADRRKKLVQLMPKAQRARERMRKVAEQLDAAAFMGIDAVDASRLREVLTGIRTNLVRLG